MADKRGPRVSERFGSLIIRFTYAGQRRSISTGLPVTEINRTIAEQRLAILKRDIALNEFDETLAKYRPGIPINPESGKATRNGKRIDRESSGWPALITVYDKYVDHKRPQCSPSTMRSQYAKWRSLLARCPVALNAGGELRSWLVQEVPTSYARRILQGLNGMGRWAEQEQLIPHNPFRGVTIAAPRTDSKDAPIEFWTRQERDRIIEGFKTSEPRHRYYAPLVEFLFLSGCRPSEALGLQWGDVAIDCKTLTFRGAIVEAEDGRHVRKEGLKRQHKRALKLSPRLTGLLAAMPRDHDNELVFPAPNGGPIVWTNFGRRSWASVLKRLGLPYLKPYSTRHTMISLALKGDLTLTPPIVPMAVEDVAAIVGNSARVIYECYAGVSRDLELPE